MMRNLLPLSIFFALLLTSLSSQAEPAHYWTKPRLKSFLIAANARKNRLLPRLESEVVRRIDALKTDGACNDSEVSLTGLSWTMAQEKLGDYFTDEAIEWELDQVDYCRLADQIAVYHNSTSGDSLLLVDERTVIRSFREEGKRVTVEASATLEGCDEPSLVEVTYTLERDGRGKWRIAAGQTDRYPFKVPRKSVYGTASLAQRR